MSAPYNWCRYWHPRERRPVIGPDGFLVDPESLIGGTVNRHLRPFPAYADAPCIALLGEAGSGKSVVLRQLFHAELPPDTTRHIVDLGAYSTDSNLVRVIFDADWFKVWRQGRERLELYLDSLDECRSRIPNVARLLREELSSVPLDRLHLRIACRTAEWPETFGEALKSLFKLNALPPQLELAPLRRADIATACVVREVDSEKFLDEVQRLNVQPLATRPITLNFLLAEFGHGGGLPQSLTEVYDRGLLRLCEDTDERTDAGAQSSLSPKQTIAVAARIAAASILGDKVAISLAAGASTPTDCVELSQLTGGTECASEPVIVGSQQLHDVVKTALFAFGGDGRRSFSHHSYAEFLAARYISLNLDQDQIWNLLGVPDEPSLCIAPQLEGLAGWLASWDTNIREKLLSVQPEVLMRGDVITGDPDTTRSLVGNLLGKLQARELVDWQARSEMLWKLAHPTLPAQLRGVLVDATSLPDTKWGAIDIAQACKCESLGEELAAFALDPAEATGVRIHAAAALSRMGTRPDKGRLRPLALGEIPLDENDELRGIGIVAAWPDYLSPAELFSCLNRPQQANFIGIYTMLLHEAPFLADLKDIDLHLALEWILKSDIGDDPLDPLRDCAKKIVFHVWSREFTAPLVDALAQVLLRRLEIHDGIWFERYAHRDEPSITVSLDKRRAVLAQMVALAPSGEALLGCVHGVGALATSDDFEWLASMATASMAVDRPKWSVLARFLFVPERAEHLQLAYDAAQGHSELGETFRPWFLAVPLGSDEAKGMRKRWELEQPSKPPGPDIATTRARVSELLQKCLAGEVEHWWRLCKALSVDPANPTHRDLVAVAIDHKPGWNEASRDQRVDIVIAARLCVAKWKPLNDGLDTGTVLESDYASFLALELLWKYNAEFLVELEPDIWARWVPGLLGWPIISPGGGAYEPHIELLGQGYKGAPDAFLASLGKAIATDNRLHQRLFILERVESIVDSRMIDVFSEQLKSGGLSVVATGQLMGMMLKHGRSYFAEQCLSLRLTGNERARTLSIEAAALLLQYRASSAWVRIWAAISEDAAWGKALVERVCGSLNWGAIHLLEADIGTLLNWLLTYYPPADDPEGGTRYMGGDESVRMWRDQLILGLQNVGTKAGEAALVALRDGHPEVPSLYWTAMRASKARQAKAWKPIEAVALLQMAADHERRHVQTVGQLLDVLVQSLIRLEVELHAVTPSNEFIWDEAAGSYKPKAEKSLSNFIKIHLDADIRTRGIVVGREVEIRQRQWPGGKPGEEVDLQVDAVSGGDIVSVIVEVKGCWNKDVKTAMETQLVGRYLKNNPEMGGLYVVGWYLCDAWDDADWRKKATPFGSLGDCRAYFRRQADVCRGNSDVVDLRDAVLDCTLS